VVERYARRVRHRSAVRLVVVLAPCVAIAVAFAACGGPRVPEPEYREHPKQATEAMCVPYPPPAAKPEETGKPPNDRAVWTDGDWIWRPQGGPSSTKGKWVWRPGAWIEPPYSATYSRSALIRMSNGALAWYAPHWHMPAHYDIKLDAAGPMSSSGLALVCPDPPPNETTGVPPPLADAGDARVGPAAVYAADAPPPAPPKIVLDAMIPTDSKEPPKLIAPPE
jgi:hypothetical protein